MKKLICTFLMLIFLCGCTPTQEYEVVASTLPVYSFTQRLCEGTNISVGRLITENVSCLHDYTLKVNQMQMLEQAEAVILNGAGLEEFLEDALHDAKNQIDASTGLQLTEDAHEEHHSHSGHIHTEDPHIWLSPKNAAVMATNISEGLCSLYPAYANTIEGNLETLLSDLEALQEYGEKALKELKCRELITFHDGFSYLAEGFDLEIIMTIEEESGSEASAKQLTSLITLVQQHELSAIFTEANGSVSAAQIVSAETGIPVYELDMGMSGGNYFDTMYRNIDTLREALS